MELTRSQMYALHYLQEHTRSLEVVLERNNPKQASFILGALALNMGHLVDGLLPLINTELTKQVGESTKLKLRVHGRKWDGDDLVGEFNTVIEDDVKVDYNLLVRKYQEMIEPVKGEENWAISFEPLR